MADRLSSTDIQQIINGHVTTDEEKNWEYYLGMNRTILRSTAKEAPDHKIPIPIARKITNTTLGYAGKQGNITFVKNDDIPNDDKMREIFQFNKENLLTTQIFRDSLINGYAYELHFVADKMPQFAKVKAEDMIIKMKENIFHK